jgi:hypothetical protein
MMGKLFNLFMGLAALLSFAVTGCSGSSTHGTGALAPTAAEGAGSPDLAGGAGVGGCPGAVLVTRSGGVRLQSHSFQFNGRTIASSLGGAGFLPDLYGAACTSRTFGACVSTLCDAPPSKGCRPAPGKPPNAGAITVTGARAPLSFAPTSSGPYTVYSSASALWVGGNTLTIDAAGGDVPAFKGTLTAPSPVTITSPAATNPVVIDRTRDFAVAWAGGGAGQVVLTLTTTPPKAGQPRTSVTCRFPVASGQGAAPAAALATLPAGDGHLGLVVGADTELKAGNWPVTLSATTLAVQADGSGYLGGRATFQ